MQALEELEDHEITAVLFDIDGTLIDHAAAVRIALREVVESFTQTSEGLAEVIQLWNDSSELYYKPHTTLAVSFIEQRKRRLFHAIQNLSGDISAAKLAELSHYFGEIYDRNCNLYSDVLPTLAALKRFRLGILSNGSNKQQSTKLRSNGIMNRFHSIVVSEGSALCKPQKEFFLMACERLESDPARTLHVGDDFQLDYNAAVSAGLCSVWINRGGSYQSIKCDSEVKSLVELSSIIANTRWPRT
jgi:putative hydrolase of the HAD superfamily